MAVKQICKQTLLLNDTGKKQIHKALFLLVTSQPKESNTLVEVLHSCIYL